MIAPEPMATCPGCGRQAPAEELVQVGDRLLCEPCQEAGVKAEQRRDSLDAAWAAVEAVLPKTHRLTTLLLADDADSPPGLPWIAFAELRPEAAPDDWLEAARHDINARGATPILALRELARTSAGAT